MKESSVTNMFLNISLYFCIWIGTSGATSPKDMCRRLINGGSVSTNGKRVRLNFQIPQRALLNSAQFTVTSQCNFDLLIFHNDLFNFPSTETFESYYRINGDALASVSSGLVINVETLFVLENLDPRIRDVLTNDAGIIIVDFARTECKISYFEYRTTGVIYTNSVFSYIKLGK